MCGIAGIINRHPSEASAAVSKMIQRLRHRGPDDFGVQELSDGAFGHARLSIIDLGGGHQPMESWDGKYSIVYNGEIYNYKTLRNELEAKGYRFRTQSDTEVLLELYRAFGEKFLTRLNGMFAFAIWDAGDKKIFAARDRMGKKPFYYATGPQREWIFASEIKAILASGLVEPRVDEFAVDAYFALGYVPPDRTIYSTIETLPPASYLTWREGNVSVHRFWAPHFSEADISEDDAVEELRSRLKESVRLRQLTSDVPVGAFLSGGLDSSTVVMLAQRESENPINTFSVHIRGNTDETPFAREVAKQEGTHHHDVELDPNVPDLLMRMADMYDEPFADPSNIPTYLLSQYAREKVKVVLTGDGGDEIFGGYEHWYLPLAESERMPNRGIKYHALRVADAGLPVPWLRSKRGAADEARCWPDALDRHLQRAYRFSGDICKKISNRDSAFTFNGERCPDDVRGLNRAFWFDMQWYLAGDILVKVDRASMAVGLETRSPLLDPQVVEFMLSLPVRMKVSKGVCKRIFRKAFERDWPASLRTRSKLGFGVPEEIWLRRPDVRKLIGDVLLDSRSAVGAWMDGKEVARSVTDYYEGKRGLNSIQVWTMLTFAIWAEKQRAGINTQHEATKFAHS